MQPYIFPYIGYFQLVNAVDKFVFYDDVNFIKQGWINRNRILVNGQPHLFSIPVKGISSFKLINEVQIDQNVFALWKNKFYKTFDAAYKKAPYYAEVRTLAMAVTDTPAISIADMASKSILVVAEYLDIKTIFVSSSAMYQNTHLKAQDRVIDICLREKASEYINVIGGKELYSKDDFLNRGITLRFIAPQSIAYKQFSEPHIQYLSIMDVLMFNPKEKIKHFLNCYELV